MRAPKNQSAAEQIEQLNMLAKAYTGRPTFKPGDFVLRRPESLPCDYRKRDVGHVAVVMETVDSLRDFLNDKSLYPGQGVLVTAVRPDGDQQTAWVGSWLYQPAPADLIASFIGQTTH